jgi:pantoate--beta-alanine ligase
MYPHGYRTFVEPGVASDPMEGEGRPGHFRGVATVVVKLLNAVHPHRAYFGRKDFQQLAVVNETVSALDLDVTIIGVPTVREADGLALSSRNVRLSIEARRQSPIIFKALNASRLTFQNGQRDSEALEKIAKDILAEAPLCRIEYVTVSNANTLIRTETCSEQSVMCVACWFEDVRLIDNIEL